MPPSTRSLVKPTERFTVRIQQLLQNKGDITIIGTCCCITHRILLFLFMDINSEFAVKKIIQHMMWMTVIALHMEVTLHFPLPGSFLYLPFSNVSPIQTTSPYWYLFNVLLWKLGPAYQYISLSSLAVSLHSKHSCKAWSKEKCKKFAFFFPMCF